MRRRGQATVLAVALGLPLLALALVGLACLGARVQAERAQRLADSAALAAALGRPAAAPPGGALEVAVAGDAVQTRLALPEVRLRLPLLRDVAYTARAASAARAVVLADGGRGAVLVPAEATTMDG